MSAHRMPAGVGRVRMLSRVRRCLPRMIPVIVSHVAADATSCGLGFAANVKAAAFTGKVDVREAVPR